MKIITKKKALKFAGLQLALLIALTGVEIGMKFMTEYRYVGFEKKQDSWYGIAQVAQADNWTCQQQLSQLQTAVEKVNQAGTADIK